MDIAGDVRIPVRHDCGHKFEVSLVGKDPHTMQYRCPGCGALDGFDAKQADSIVAQYNATKLAIQQALEGRR